MNGSYRMSSIFLADDDPDDRYLFEDAFNEVAKEAQLIMANNGVELMEILDHSVPPPPEVIFLDLNMPLKSGFECLSEIRETQKLKDIPVVIFSTTTEKEYIDRVFKQGANYYLCKPTSFAKLKQAISQVLAINWSNEKGQPSREQFVLDC